MRPPTIPSSRPAGDGRALGDHVAAPPIGARVRLDELCEREGLTDAAPELLADRLDLREQPLVQHAVAGGRLDAAVALLPLLTDDFDGARHGRPIVALRGSSETAFAAWAVMLVPRQGRREHR